MKRFSETELHAICYDDVDGVVEHPYTDAGVLHMGSCDLFAVALHERFGYEICRVDYEHSFHMFCRTEIEGKTVYIDASGMSTNLQDLQLGEKIGEIYSVDEVTCDGEFDDIGLGFARRFIEKHKEYFDIEATSLEDI
jgi:hypothetical protein